MAPPWEGGKKGYLNGALVAATPIYGKTLQKSSPTELIDFDLETWHRALCTQALQSLYINDDPELTLTYFTTMSNFGETYFYTPCKLCLWEGILFSRCPSKRPSDHVSVMFCFLNILKNHLWNFIKFCKHVLMYKTNTTDE